MAKTPALPFATEAEIVAIGEGLLDHTLPRAAWTHTAHLTAATWIVLRRPDLDAERDLPRIIAAYNLAAGGRNTDTEGYHHTITLASLHMIRGVLRGVAAQTPLALAIAAVLESALSRKDWVFAYWRRETLMSVEARRAWVEPDLAPLPPHAACAVTGKQGWKAP